MPTSLDANSSGAEIDAISTLLFHCGVAVETDFAVQKSYAILLQDDTFYNAERSLVDFFDYKNTIQGYSRANFTQQQWENMLRFELDNERPVIYGASGTDAEHVFVIDGYDNNGFFHINWGWGGLSNGYFAIQDLAPSSTGIGGGTGNYSFGHHALIMIEPSNSTLAPNPYTANYDVELLITQGFIVNPFTNIPFKSNFDLSFEVTNFGKDTMKNGYLMPGFLNLNDPNSIAVPHSILATIGDNESVSYTISYLADTPTFKKGTYLVMLFAQKDTTLSSVDQILGIGASVIQINITEELSLKQQQNINHSLLVYPNPAKQKLHVKLDDPTDKIASYTLLDVTGGVVKSYTNIQKQQVSLTTNNLSSGAYLLIILTEKGQAGIKNIVIERAIKQGFEQTKNLM